MEEFKKNNSHFEQIKKFNIPKIEDVLLKLKKMSRKRDNLNAKKDDNNQFVGQKGKFLSRLLRNKKIDTPVNNDSQKRKGFRVPVLELRKMIETIEKQQQDKLHQEIENNKKKLLGFLRKKLLCYMVTKKWKKW